ncbi:MAG: YndJ family transporter, partial [Opitutaceae bacterium]|nr:YndJ family transporter [Opitutaceae bacterium]
RPLGFSPDIVLLTAVHFHFAGLVLPVVTGLVLARHPQSRAAHWSAWGVLLGVPLVAAGISAVQLGWGGAIECLAAIVLVLSAWGVAWQHARLAVEEKIGAAILAHSVGDRGRCIGGGHAAGRSVWGARLLGPAIVAGYSVDADVARHAELNRFFARRFAGLVPLGPGM